MSSRTSSEQRTLQRQAPLPAEEGGTEPNSLSPEEAARRSPAAAAQPKPMSSKGERTGAVFRTGDDGSINDDAAAADDTALHLPIR